MVAASKRQLTQTPVCRACRPVTLHKWLLMGIKVVDSKAEVVDTIDCSANWSAHDSKPCAILTQQTLDQGHSVLIFCCSKQASNTRRAKSIRVDIPWTRISLLFF